MSKNLLKSVVLVALATAAAWSNAGSTFQVKVAVPGLRPAPAQPSATGIVTTSGVKAWTDGTAAASCLDYLTPTAPYTYTGDTGDGTYAVLVGGTRTSVYCDMTNNGGGWVLLVRPQNNNKLGVYNFTQTDPVLPTSPAGVQSALWSVSSAYPLKALRFTDAGAPASTWAIATFASKTSLSGLNSTYSSYTQNPTSATVTTSSTRAAVTNFWIRGKSGSYSAWNDSADWLYMGFSDVGAGNSTGDQWDTAHTNWVLGGADNTNDPQTSFTSNGGPRYGWSINGNHWWGYNGGDSNLQVWAR